MRSSPKSLFPFALAWLCLVVLPVHSDVRLPAIFGDNMVLQQGMKVPVWGTASPGERVSVGFGRGGPRTVADENGEWEVRVPTPPPGGPYRMIVRGDNRVVLETVLVGDSLNNDVAGAKAFGLPVIWFNPSRSPLIEGNHAPDAEIARLEDLLDLLRV